MLKIKWVASKGKWSKKMDEIMPKELKDFAQREVEKILTNIYNKGK